LSPGNKLKGENNFIFRSNVTLSYVCLFTLELMFLDLFHFYHLKNSQIMWQKVNETILASCLYWEQSFCLLLTRTKVIIVLLLSLLSFFGVTGIWTQDSPPAKQVHHYLSHTSSLFCSGYFADVVLGTLCLGWQAWATGTWLYSSLFTGDIKWLITNAKSQWNVTGDLCRKRILDPNVERLNQNKKYLSYSFKCKLTWFHWAKKTYTVLWRTCQYPYKI
jgi:hypothetical protein